MQVIGVIDGPKLLEGHCPAIMEIRRGIGDPEQMRNVKGLSRVVPAFGAHIEGKPHGVQRRRVAGHAALGDRDIPFHPACEWRRKSPWPVLLGGGQLAVRIASHSRRRQRLDKRRQVEQFLFGEGVRAHQHPGKARSALDFEAGVLAVPLERAGARNPLQTTVIEQVVADAVAVKIITEAIHVPVQVARPAGELMLERVGRGRKNPLSSAGSVVGAAVPPNLILPRAFRLLASLLTRCPQAARQRTTCCHPR